MSYTLIIQGRPSIVALMNIQKYLTIPEIEKIIISIWNNDEGVTDLARNIVKNCNKVELIISVLPEVKNSGFNIETTDYYNEFNVYYQVKSTLPALEKVTTKFVLKTRSDERYTDFSKVFEYLDKEPNKLVTSNVFFRPDNWHKYHASDHFMAGRTDYIRRGFQIALEKCERKRPLPIMNLDHTFRGSPEQVIHSSIIEGMGIEPSLENSREIVLANYNMVRAEELGDYIIRSNMHGVSFTPNDYPVKVDNCRVIGSLRDL